MTYADGSTVKMTYNAAGKVCAEKWYNADNEQVAHYKYIYDGNGNIVKTIDIFYHREYNYTYTEGMLTRCLESYVDFGEGEIIVRRLVLNTIYYVYNKDHQLVRKVIVDTAGKEFVITNETDENNGTSVSFKAGGKTVTSHSKTDGFGRKVFDELLTGEGYLNRSFEYLPGAITPEHTENGKIKSNPVTTLVKYVRYSDGREISYEYDAEEKITKVTDSLDGVTEYEYDAQGQLVSETVNGVKTRFVYDSCGNILEKGVCGEDGEIAAETKTVYTYGDSTWKDLLTAVNGQTISYDAGGNPVSYLGHTLTWEKGRQLKSFDSNTYTYNANGIRTAKTVDRTRHDYTIEGVKILREKWGTNTIVPCYDNEGAVCGIIYNDTPYYFVKNLQGDVIAITDTTGAVVARYSYDAWGVPTTVSDTTEIGIADINPYRYRSYYYDSEIGMYYLQSRYYDPTLSRFINADDASYAATQGHNLFTYCGNNCIVFSDPIGTCYYCNFRKKKKRVVVLDPGHGGTEMGASIKKRVSGALETFYEKNFNLRVAISVRRLLIKVANKCSVVMTRYSDVAISLKDRYILANNNKADVFVSIHHNSTNPFKKGYWIQYAGKHSTFYSSELASTINHQFSVLTELSRYASPSANTELAVLNGTTMPAVLVECGFMNQDFDYCNNNYETIAEAIYKGILNFLNRYINF